jgi:tetratricopeptide (TPR) repeat protein
MKRQERHHLKENELAQTLAAARDFIEPRSKQIGYLAMALVAVAVVVLGIMVLRQRSNAQAQQALTEAMVALNARVIPPSDPGTEALPASALLGSTGTFTSEAAKLKAALPKLRAAADTYPNAEPGIVARYHLAGALAALGQNEEAAKEFAGVVERTDSTSLYGRMARMGQADSQARAGQLDQAIAAWKQLADQKDPGLPADAILIQLARAYKAKGNAEEARKTLTELVDQHPASPYSAEARSELETLKG